MSQIAPEKVELHNLDSLFDVMISGRPLQDIQAQIYVPLSEDARLILAWFKRNPEIWPGVNKAEHLDGILEALGESLPEILVDQPNTIAKKHNSYRISKFRASRFGGLHEFGDAAVEPTALEIDFLSENHSAALLYGRNGCGKSSLLSAICWCLTGYYFTTQAGPKKGTAVAAYRSPSITELAEEESILTAPIIPMPSPAQLRILRQGKVTAETWAEVELVNATGVKHGPFRRRLLIRKGKTTEEVDGDLNQLGLSPADLELGTLLSGMLPHIRLDEKSGFGSAVASLIGIQPLAQIATHAEKMISKIKKTSKSLNAELQSLITEINQQTIQVTNCVNGMPDNLKESWEICRNDISESSLATFIKNATDAQGVMLKVAQQVLGENVHLDALDDQTQLMNDVAIASHLLSPLGISKLDVTRKWNDFFNLNESTLNDAETLLNVVFHEATSLEELQGAPDRSKRIQLYAKIAQWLHDFDFIVTEGCPVCGALLEDRKDPVDGGNIKQHLLDCYEQKNDAWSKTPKRWSEDALARLKANVPIVLQFSSSKDSTTVFGEGLVKAIATEVCFDHSLINIKNDIESRWQVAQFRFLSTRNSTVQSLPPSIREVAPDLEKVIVAIQNNIAECRDVKSKPKLQNLIETALFGKLDSSEDCPRNSLKQLEDIIRTAEPANKLIKAVIELQDLFRKKQALSADLHLYSRAEKALAQFNSLSSLVQTQVNGLLEKLASRHSYWLDQIYTPARTERPKIDRATLSEDGRLGFNASHFGTISGAHHVANASHLRAALVAFWIAYWEYRTKEFGGLRTILMDDMQELFDEENQSRFARSIKDIIAINAQVILASNKVEFFKGIEWAKCNAKRWQIDWRSGSPSVQLIEYRDALEKSFDSFNSDDSDDNAQSLMIRVRIYCESRLITLFRHTRPHSLGDQPTFMSAVQAIQQFSNNGTTPFDGEPIKSLLDHDGCKPGTKLYQILNDAHHSRCHLITSGEVHLHLTDINELTKRVDRVCDHCESTKFKSHPEILATRDAGKWTPSRLQLPSKSLPVWSAIAASDSGKTGGETELYEKKFDWSNLGNVTIFQILSNSLGFSAPRYCRVLVSLEQEDIQTDSLVIARVADHFLARRAITVPKQRELILHSDEVDPRRRARIEVVDPTTGGAIFPVIGVIWDLSPPKIRTKGEAALDEEYRLGDLDLEVAQSVIGASGEPFVLTDQSVIVGKEIHLRDLHGLDDMPVVVEVIDQFGTSLRYLKRVSNLNFDHNRIVRVFNPIGGHGDPLIARLPSEEEYPQNESLPTIARVRPMRVVLYETAFRIA